MTEDVVKAVMVVGLAFRGREVLLVEKRARRPSMRWQDGLWNGVGGLVEPGEQPIGAMIREFREETGVSMAWPGEGDEIPWWRKVAVEVGHDYELHVYVTNLTKNHVVPPYNDVGERLSWIDLDHFTHVAVVGNLRWLIPLARDWRDLSYVVVHPRGDIRERPTW